ncbi:type II toxin-antitoxin system RelE/ParE family toxin [Pirellulales bacterium]|nr:type II toxin-antitoxin system RelE/ParE family toxin [Pirellulales bacterium]
MRLSVIVTPRARIEFYNDALWWAENRSINQASRWLDGFEQAIKLLAETADSYPLARENDDFPFDIRQMNYGIGSKPTHRAVFEIRDEKVIVHGIRHLSRRELTPDDL